MPPTFFEAQPRNFNPMSIPGLSNEAREAVNAALQAMSNWRAEAAGTNEKNGKQVLAKMAAAAAALGWPTQVVDAARMQMQSISEMQIKTMDHIMDTWEEQLKLPNPAGASPSAMLSRLKSSPGLGARGGWPGLDPNSAMNPLQMWMQMTQQWQKQWADAMSFWDQAGRPH